MGVLWRRMQYLLHRRRMQRELEDEMSAHREMLGEHRASFGSILKLREEFLGSGFQIGGLLSD